MVKKAEKALENAENSKNEEQTNEQTMLDMFDEDTERYIAWDAPQTQLFRGVEFVKETTNKKAKLYSAQVAIIQKDPTTGESIIVEWQPCKFVAPGSLNTQINKIDDLAKKNVLVKYTGIGTYNNREFKSFVVKSGYR